MTPAPLRSFPLPRRVTSAAVLCLVLSLVACGSESPPPEPPPPPPPPPVVTLESIELTPVNPSLEPGQMRWLSATGVFSDSTRRDLTESVSWTSSAPEIATVSEQPSMRGTITGVAPGTATISARHAATGKVGEVTVTVLTPAPVLVSVEPNEGPVAGGTAIELIGLGFVPGTTVTIGGVPVSNLTRDTEGRLTGVTPPGTRGPKDVVVTNARASVTLAGGFRYRAAPTLTAVEPASGPVYGGTLITVRGTDLVAGTTISLGGAELQNVTRVDETTWTGTTPAGAVGTQELVVTTTYGTGTLGGRFSYYDPWLSANTGLYGGSVMALVRHPSDPSILYAGMAQGGVYRSVNGGQSWTPINNGLNRIDVRSLAIDPSTPSTLYVGTTWGVFKSTNSGASWFRPTTELPFSYVQDLVIDRANPATVYAGIPNEGVLKTTDGGVTWTAVNTGLGNSLYIQSLVMSPADPQVLYVGTMNGAIFKTTNGGASWAPARTGVPESVLYIYSLAIDPQAPDTVYAGSTHGLYKTTNGGGSWALSSTGMGLRRVGALAVGVGSSSTIYAGTDQGIFKSTNGGANWASANVGLLSEEVNDLLTDASSPSTLYAGTLVGGLYKTTDAAATWSAARTGLTSMHVRALAFSSAPDIAYAGTSNGVYKTADGGASWSEVNQGLDNRNVRVLAIHPTDPAVVYAGTYRGLYKTVNGGASWVLVFSPTDIIESVAIHPTSPETVFVGTSRGLSKSTNGGSMWTGLTQGLPSSMWARAIAISRQSPSTMYVASQDRVFRSTDEGGLWVQMSNGLPAGIEANDIQVAPGTTDTVFLLSANGGLHKTTSGGTSWAHVFSNGNGYALAIDPSNPQTLYVGTITDIQKSRDGGQTWKGVSAPFHIDVEALAVKPGSPSTVLAGTLGRGVYKTTTAGE